MRRVDFFIVGAMRSGTSSLRDALMLNPRINVPRGEPMFFNRTENYAKGLEHYHSLFDWDDQFVVRGEKSPPYAVTPEVPERLRDYNPGAKIVWTLRDPVKRAISHYQHSRFRTKEALTLSYAIENKEKLEKECSSMAYVYRSEYHKHIRRWLDFFPLEQHSFIILEELLENPEAELRKVHQFLGAPWHEGVFLPHSKNKKMAAFTRSMKIDEHEIEELEHALSPTRKALEETIGRPIHAWRKIEGRRNEPWLKRVSAVLRSLRKTSP